LTFVGYISLLMDSSCCVYRHPNFDFSAPLPINRVFQELQLTVTLQCE